MSVVLSFAVPAALVIGLMPRYIAFLRSRGRVTGDAHKSADVRVPTPAGPLLVAALVVGELIAWAVYGTVTPLVVAGAVTFACVIGLYDDLKGLGGVTKPALLMLGGLFVVVLEHYYPEVYDARVYFPFMTVTGTHFIIFAVIVLASIPVASNAFNMLDAFNGEISGFTTIVSVALVAATAMRAYSLQGTTVASVAMALPLLSVAASFYLFNRYPSKVFDGDSGSLSFGAAYVVLSVVGGVEIAALVALIPAVINSYYILSSVRGLVERKQIRARPTEVGADLKIYASTQPGAPTTLARMLLLGGPLDERSLVNKILLLAAFAALLSVATSAITWLL